MIDLVKALRNRATWETATGINEPHEHIDWMAADEITRLREENARLREALLFAELMASEIGIDPREKCQRIYDELYKIRTAATAIQDGGNNDSE